MISQLSQEQWDNRVVELGGSILQSVVWGEFQEALGYKTYRFNDSEFISLVVEVPLAMGKKYLYSPRGPLGDPEAALVDIKKLAAENRDILFVRLEPGKVMDLPQAAKETQPSKNWMLGLDKMEEELLISMKPKHRYNINLAQRRGVNVREGNKEDLLIFWKLLLETAGRNKFSLHPQNYYWQLWETLFPKHLKLFISEYLPAGKAGQGKPLGAILVTMFEDTATFMHGGSSSANKDVMAPYLLHWKAIKQAKSLGLKNYDFGGISSDPNHSWSGITRFKKGFGGFEVDYPGTFDLVFSPFWYQAYKQARILRKIFKRPQP
ncbi:MAG: peptidoglycan bridge formation glycyltransferase FemA/FemB family protein [bacterium]|nr:peptidoglycan bridge formation glycyltransferase FemA/FemB family protein [bacterium]